MNRVQLHEKLIAAARAHRPSDEVPYAFESRVLARLRAVPAIDHCGFWAQALWRAAAPCVVIMLLLGAFSLWVPAASSTAGDLSQEFENTLLAAADQDSATDSAW